MFNNFCVRQSFPGLPGDTIGKIDGLKACLNASEGYAAAAANNIMIRVKDFTPSDSDLSAIAAMQKVLVYLAH